MNEKYLSYTASDFGSDEVFTAWVLQQKEDAAWRSWIKANDSKKSEIDLATKYVQALSQLPVNEQNEESKQRIWKQIKSGVNVKAKKKKFRWTKLWPLALALCIALLIYFFMPGGTGSYTTVFGEKKSIRLPDQSEMVLNAQSRATWDIKSFNKNRVVVLEGEGFFSVKPGIEFNVQTNEAMITAVGTSFNVFARDGVLEVRCYSGEIRVATLKDVAGLSHGKQATLRPTADTLAVSGFTNNMGLPEWIKGTFAFEGQEFSLVIDELERQYNVEVDFPSNYTDIPFTGRFELGNLEKALQQITWPLDLQFRIDNKKITISPK